MSGEEDPKPVNIDPRCIQEALRMYFQPIKNDDPQFDFYTMYKRETMEYDTEYMQKHNEDLNTTLIFAGLFSAVSSAFAIDVQSKLEPDPGERSEAYLRAILLSLDRSISPDEDPAAPPVWSGPPQEIITTSNLLYASLLMSLLAAFVAMLGKQWLNRYLRHTGGSTIERCGDRQRKFDGLERWPFRLFIESLPIMLQIALLLLTCGLSRYMWSVNTSVARVIISSTVLGFLFYLVIMVAGTSSYECPFQTPASMALRDLRDNKTVRKWLSSLSLLNIISLIYTARKNTPKLMARVSLPNPASLIYATWMDAQQGIILASHRARDIVRRPLSWKFSVSGILSGIRRTATKIGHQVIILLLQMDRALGNANQRLGQEIRGFGRVGLLPTSTGDVFHQPFVSHNGPGLRLRIWNLEDIRRQNGDNARCVSWVLRNITDPEAIDSAIRLAGTIRWFDGDPDHNPPFDLIVSTFETCFDSTKQLYPGMRDRAYFSARAILQINMRARSRSQDHVSKYSIPAVSADSFQDNDPDLSHLIHMLEGQLNAPRPTVLFPDETKITRIHSLWLSNLLVDLTHVGPNPILQSYESYLTITRANHQAAIANTLLVWYMFLGGHVGEETIWAVDKSDSLEVILSHLSARVIGAIANGNCVEHLGHLLDFLAAWKERPACLTPMVYQWCSAFSGIITGPSQDWPSRSQAYILMELLMGFNRLEEGFTKVGPGCDPVHLAYGRRRNLALHNYMDLFCKTLEIGFRLARPGRDWPAIRLDHTLFEVAFSSTDDEVITDAVYTWIADSDCTSNSSLARYLAHRVEQPKPFSPRLRQAGIYAISCAWNSQLIVPAPETVHLLNRLEADMDMDEMGREEMAGGMMEGIVNWVNLLVSVIRSPTGFESLSSHNWRLLSELVWTMGFDKDLVERDVEVMRSLEKVEDWEKLEVWMEIIWMALGYLTSGDSMGEVSTPESIQDIERVTLKLSLRQPSALQRFENLCTNGTVWEEHMQKLEGICKRARVERLPLEPPPPPPPQSIHTQPLTSLPLWGDDTF